jgi:hypothetical protein
MSYRCLVTIGLESKEAQNARHAEFVKNTKDFAKEMMKKFTFEEVAELFYSNSCVFCPNHHECSGADSVKECVSAIREKYDVDYWKEQEWRDEDI